MANEIKKDEVLSEEQLENVAGGTIMQVASDGQALRDTGAIKEFAGQKWGNYAVGQNFDDYSSKLVAAWAELGVTCIPSKDGENTYSMGGTEITRWGAFQVLEKATGKKINPMSYGFPTNDRKKLQ